MKKFSLLILFALTLCGVGAAPIHPSEVGEAVKNAQPGTIITIADGIYRDIVLTLDGNGTEGRPVFVKAETPGGVVFTGKSALKITGKYLIVSDLYYKDGSPASGPVIEFRAGGKAANNCRVTNCVIDSYNPAKRNIDYSYVHLYGRNNKFDHNTLLNKLNLGVTLIVMLNEESDQQNFHEITANYFGPRPVYGSNGAETIRVGTSQQAYKSSNTLIAGNYFEHCDGEVEVVSVKSSDNIVRGNIFYECQGVVALRHGDRNLVEDNMFDGKNVRNTGGVRVVNAGHTIRKNQFFSLVGERFFSALALMSAVPNSLPNRYCQVENIVIEENVFIGCAKIEFGTGKDQERTLMPRNVRFERNTIMNKKLKAPFDSLGPLENFTFRDNFVSLGKTVNRRGFRDIRNSSADQITESGVMKGFGYPATLITKKETGAEWYVPKPANVVRKGRVVAVAPGLDNLPEAADKAQPGDILEIYEGDYPITRSIDVRHPITIRAVPGQSNRPVVKFVGTRKANMVTILDGGELTISGIAFSGELTPGKVLAGAGISTDDGMIQPYNLTVDGCEFYDFGEGGFFAVKGMKNTFADSIVVRNSIFRGLSGDAINYAAERDDIGRYNADNVIIENCLFYQVLGLGINIYRGGSDESTAGPYVTIANCTFEDVCNKERGSVMRLIGPQVMTITACSFSNSGRGGAAIRLDEATWEKIDISRCNFWNSGGIVSMTGKVLRDKPMNIQPVYRNAEKLDFRPVEGTALAERKIGINW